VQVVDANVLLYAVNRDSVHHGSAREWLDGELSSGGTVAFVWMSMLAFVRLATHPSVFPSPLSIEDAMATVRAWLEQPNAVVVEAGPRHADLLTSLLGIVGSGGNLVNDAHLAAIAIEHRGEVISFDNDFARFEGVRWRSP
jgi:toxin-antitoxin system PIN domain toxin